MKRMAEFWGSNQQDLCRAGIDSMQSPVVTVLSCRCHSNNQLQKQWMGDSIRTTSGESLIVTVQLDCMFSDTDYQSLLVYRVLFVWLGLGSTQCALVAPVLGRVKGSAFNHSSPLHELNQQERGGTRAGSRDPNTFATYTPLLGVAYDWVHSILGALV